MGVVRIRLTVTSVVDVALTVQATLQAAGEVRLLPSQEIHVVFLIHYRKPHLDFLYISTFPKTQSDS